MSRCDLCRQKIEKNRRYALRMALYAAYDGLEIEPWDLSRNLEKEVQEAVKKTKGRSARAIEADVVKCYDFSLCTICRDNFIREIQRKFHHA